MCLECIAICSAGHKINIWHVIKPARLISERLMDYCNPSMQVTRASQAYTGAWWQALGAVLWSEPSLSALWHDMHPLMETETLGMNLVPLIKSTHSERQYSATANISHFLHTRDETLSLVTVSWKHCVNVYHAHNGPEGKCKWLPHVNYKLPCFGIYMGEGRGIQPESQPVTVCACTINHLS